MFWRQFWSGVKRAARGVITFGILGFKKLASKIREFKRFCGGRMDEAKDALTKLFEGSYKPGELDTPEDAVPNTDQFVTQKHRTSPILDHPRGSVQLVHMHQRLRELLEFFDKNFSTLVSVMPFLADIVAAKLRVSVIPLGPWNMDSTSDLSVAHSIDPTKIVSISIVVIDDAGAESNIAHYGGAYGSDPVANDLWVTFITSSYIGLTRRDSGLFDSASHDDSSMNRGNLLVFYTE